VEPEAIKSERLAAVCPRKVGAKHARRRREQCDIRGKKRTSGMCRAVVAYRARSRIPSGALDLILASHPHLRSAPPHLPLSLLPLHPPAPKTQLHSFLPHHLPLPLPLVLSHSPSLLRSFPPLSRTTHSSSKAPSSIFLLSLCFKSMYINQQQSNFCSFHISGEAFSP
jgi:hypothetical protein